MSRRPQEIDISRKRFGRLIALRKVEAGRWLCRCECGGEKKILKGDLTSGRTQSCGCLRSEKAAARKLIHGHGRHGIHASATYSSWRAMIVRCENPKLAAYPRYGGRGIKVCKRWRESFEAFLADMGECPSGMQIERKNNNGHYEPRNCQWATRVEQANNTSRNRMITIGGVTRSLAEWTRHLGLNPHTVKSRLVRGWSIARALS